MSGGVKAYRHLLNSKYILVSFCSEKFHDKVKFRERNNSQSKLRPLKEFKYERLVKNFSQIRSGLRNSHLLKKM